MALVLGAVLLGLQAWATPALWRTPAPRPLPVGPAEEALLVRPEGRPEQVFESVASALLALEEEGVGLTPAQAEQILPLVERLNDLDARRACLEGEPEGELEALEDERRRLQACVRGALREEQRARLEILGPQPLRDPPTCRLLLSALRKREP